MLHRRHHCRCCAMVYCSKCANQWGELTTSSTELAKNKVRLCGRCAFFLDRLNTKEFSASKGFVEREAAKLIADINASNRDLLPRSDQSISDLQSNPLKTSIPSFQLPSSNSDLLNIDSLPNPHHNNTNQQLGNNNLNNNNQMNIRVSNGGKEKQNEETNFAKMTRSLFEEKDTPLLNLLAYWQTNFDLHTMTLPPPTWPSLHPDHPINIETIFQIPSSPLLLFPCTKFSVLSFVDMFDRFKLVCNVSKAVHDRVSAVSSNQSDVAVGFGEDAAAQSFSKLQQRAVMLIGLVIGVQMKAIIETIELSDDWMRFVDHCYAKVRFFIKFLATVNAHDDNEQLPLHSPPPSLINEQLLLHSSDHPLDHANTNLPNAIDGFLPPDLQSHLVVNQINPTNDRVVNDNSINVNAINGNESAGDIRAPENRLSRFFSRFKKQPPSDPSLNPTNLTTNFNDNNDLKKDEKEELLNSCATNQTTAKEEEGGRFTLLTSLFSKKQLQPNLQNDQLNDHIENEIGDGEKEIEKSEVLIESQSNNELDHNDKHNDDDQRESSYVEPNLPIFNFEKMHSDFSPVEEKVNEKDHQEILFSSTLMPVQNSLFDSPSSTSKLFKSNDDIFG